MVISKIQVKIYVWYDNECGYAHHLLELTVRWLGTSNGS